MLAAIKPKSTKAPRKIVFITHAPQGTLGDPSSALKVMDAMQKKYGDQVELHLMVDVKPEYVQKVRGIIPKGVKFVTVQLSSTEKNFEKKGHQNRYKLLKHCDGIVLYPTPHHFTSNQLKELKAFDKPIIAATEYDIDVNRNREGLERLRGISYFGTGLGKNIRGKCNLGIFLTDEQTEEHLWLSKITYSKDLALKNFLLELKSTDMNELEKEEKYYENHQLYFGYYNNLNGQHPKSNINPYEFIKSCLYKSMTKEPIPAIDIVLPLSIDPISDSVLTNADEVISKLTSDFPNINVAFYKKQKGGKFKCLQKIESEGAVATVRIINGFPLAQSTMNSLMKASDPLCLVTGDQSISEAISNEKIILYQTMIWKSQFFSELTESVKKYLGSDSVLYRFFQMQLSAESNVGFNQSGSNSIQNFIVNYDRKLRTEMRIFHQKLFQYHNLNDNLPREIMRITHASKIEKERTIQNASTPHTLPLVISKTRPRLRIRLGKTLQVNKISPETPSKSDEPNLKKNPKTH